MSIVKIAFHEESIYNVEKKKDTIMEILPRYNSKFNEKVRVDRNAVKDCHRTFGYAHVPLERPEEYLKKKCGIRPKPHQRDHNHYEIRLKAPMPDRSKSCEPCKKDVNFRMENIKKIVSVTPNRPKPRCADTRKGDIFDMEKSGLLPKFIHQPKFGKVPKYLINRMVRSKNLESQETRDEDYENKDDFNNKLKCRAVQEEEREELLRGLKYNWAQLHRQFQALPILTDTAPKIARKLKLEQELKKLEKDILLLVNNPNIYIYEN